MASITTINSGDLISNSRADLNNNFQNLNSDKLETSYLTTDDTFAGASNSKIPSQLAVKNYVDVGGNVNASETQKGVCEEASDAEVTAGTATGSTGAKLFVTPAKLATKLSSSIKFGGNGSDGALTITSGATNIDLGGLAVVTKNYTSISITGTGSLTFSNPNANGTIKIIKCSGNVTLTSSATPMIDASGLGASAATIGAGPLIATNKGANAGAGASGVGGVGVYQNAIGGITDKRLPLFVGGGGGTSGTQVGGRGGGALYIECAGSLNFTTASGISVAGKVGTVGQSTGSGATGYGGAGGGAGGCCIILYNSLVANSGTVTISGGDGGAGGGTYPGNGGAGGNGLTGGVGTGGAGSAEGSIAGGSGGGASGFTLASGSNGNNSTGSPGTGGGAGGASGYSLVALNSEFS